MKAKRKAVTKDVRVVVRVEEADADWLVQIARKADASVGYVIRKAIRKYRTSLEDGQESFRNPSASFAGA